MVVSGDVKNIDNMLLIPSGCKLTARQIGILQAWGVSNIEVVACDGTSDTDVLAKLSPEELEGLSAEVRRTFWKADDSDPVFTELFKLILQRRAGLKRQIST